MALLFLPLWVNANLKQPDQIQPDLIQPDKLQLRDNGVILVYHHVSEQTPPSTSVSPSQFRQHLAWLNQHHTVLPLKEMVAKLKLGEPLPDKAVAITFDDGYLNILENAHPILKEYGFLYTVFLNTELVGNRPDLLSWEQIQQMHSEGVDFANHNKVHMHLLEGLLEDNRQQWLGERIMHIEQAEQILEDKLGDSLKYIAYPYGEYNRMLADTISSLGYIGFGQHSGAIASYSDFAALPRFPAAGVYANLNTLKVKLNSLALQVDHQDYDPALAANVSPENLTLKVLSQDFYPSQFGCFFNGEPVEIEWQAAEVDIRIPSPVRVGRSRVNCTSPSKSSRGRYYWYSTPMFKPREDGSYPE